MMSKDLLFLVADNLPVMEICTDLVRVSFIGCASHLLNLAVKEYDTANSSDIRRANSYILDKIEDIIRKLRTLKGCERLFSRANINERYKLRKVDR